MIGKPHPASHGVSIGKIAAHIRHAKMRGRGAFGARQRGRDMSFGKTHPAAAHVKHHMPHMHRSAGGGGGGSGVPGADIGPGPFASAVPQASGGFPAASADPQLASNNGPDVGAADSTTEDA